MTDLADLRRFAIARSLRTYPSLRDAMHAQGYVQADPIRSPARAQDLILRHRVSGYRVGDLDRAYPELGIEEDFFINYGFVPASVQAMMLPRIDTRLWDTEKQATARALRDFIAARGIVHPRQVDDAFQLGTGQNWFGGNSKISTKLLEGMHYRGMVRVAGRQGGTRLYEVAPERHAREDVDAVVDRLADIVIDLYAPLTLKGLRYVIAHLQWFAMPQWADRRKGMVARARSRLATIQIDGTEWFWPVGEDPASTPELPDAVRILSPFDPVVWDRGRFEALWGWVYRFEAYTPAPKRVLGYYAMPLLWREAMIGWANLSVVDGALRADLGFVDGDPPSDTRFAACLTAELAAFASFMGVANPIR